MSRPWRPCWLRWARDVAKHDPTQEKIDYLKGLLREEPSAAGVEEVRKLLAHRSNHIVARAAAVAEAWKRDDMAEALAVVFFRFLERGSETDKGCGAKLAIVTALSSFEYANDRLYLAGVKHVQMEPVFGGVEDTAGALRGACLQALATTHYAFAHLELAALLMDRRPEARRAAVSTAAWMADDRAEVALRVKALAGDNEPDVLADAFQALMRFAPERSVEFVARFLDAEELVAEGAALALGESHREDAWAELRRAWDRPARPNRRAFLLLPMALMRTDESFTFLLGVLREERASLAAWAASALSLYAGDAKRVEEIRDAAAGRTEREVHAALDALSAVES